ncbi:uncharacterized protein LOC132042062 [Lycium ferocissimum]|uniref:uncharacterized protein LOC132042062 n=1 Tax=Lycium ferocissimum TaxID=112874 RepID=UPI0028161C47|nr:uncharacterized protein LOC132042062 [Lycium ferocissimum]
MQTGSKDGEVKLFRILPKRNLCKQNNFPMMKTLVWNFRAVNTHKAFHKVQMLHKHRKFVLISLLEPFQQSRHIDRYKRRLGMNLANHNCNGKIWFFVTDGIEVDVLMDTDQQVTIKMLFQDSGKCMILNIVYAKCDAGERMVMWDNTYQLASFMDLPWMVGGDFNVIMHEEEKIGGLLVYPAEYEDFAFCMNSCELSEVEFKGSPFTWWNGRAGHDCIFKRLDRILVN